jgi:hypothetical protein
MQHVVCLQHDLMLFTHVGNLAVVTCGESCCCHNSKALLACKVALLGVETDKLIAPLLQQAPFELCKHAVVCLRAN